MAGLFEGFQGIWQRHSWLVVNLCAPLLPLLLLRLVPPTTPQARIELGASLAVYLLPAAWAWWIANSARRSLSREERLLGAIENNGRELQERLSSQQQSGGGELQIDQQTWTKFLPDMQEGAVTSASVRMVQSLCHEASSGRFPPILTTTQIYTAEITAAVRRLRAPQTLALRLGILGTFVGLLLALGELGDLASKATTPEEGFKTIKVLVGNIKIAFGTSVAGLLAAILSQFFAEALAASYSRTSKQIEDVIGQVVTVLSMAMTGTHLARTADALTERMDNHQRELLDHADNVRRATGEGIRAIDNNAAALQDGVVALRGSHSTLSQMMNHHNSLMDQLRSGLNAVAAVDGKLASALQTHLDFLQRASQAMAAASGNSVREALAPMQTALVRQAEHTDGVAASLETTLDRVEQATQSLVLVAQAFKTERDSNAALLQAISKLSVPARAVGTPPSWKQTILWATALAVLLLHAAMLIHIFRQ